MACEDNCVRFPPGQKTWCHSAPLEGAFWGTTTKAGAVCRQSLEGSKPPCFGTASAELQKILRVLFAGYPAIQVSPVFIIQWCFSLFRANLSVLGIVEHVVKPKPPIINTHFPLQMFSLETCCRCEFPSCNCVLWHSRSRYPEHVHVQTHLRGEGKMGADQLFSSDFCTSWNAVMWGLPGLVHNRKTSLPCTCGYPRFLSWNLCGMEVARPWSAQSSWVQSLPGAAWTRAGLAEGNKPAVTVKPR